MTVYAVVAGGNCDIDGRAAGRVYANERAARCDSAGPDEGVNITRHAKVAIYELALPSPTAHSTGE